MFYSFGFFPINLINLYFFCWPKSSARLLLSRAMTLWFSQLQCLFKADSPILSTLKTLQHKILNTGKEFSWKLCQKLDNWEWGYQSSLYYKIRWTFSLTNYCIICFYDVNTCVFCLYPMRVVLRSTFRCTVAWTAHFLE